LQRLSETSCVHEQEVFLFAAPVWDVVEGGQRPVATAVRKPAGGPQSPERMQLNDRRTDLEVDMTIWKKRRQQYAARLSGGPKELGRDWSAQVVSGALHAGRMGCYAPRGHVPPRKFPPECAVQKPGNPGTHEKRKPAWRIEWESLQHFSAHRSAG
jgi:hypothetical protein